MIATLMRSAGAVVASLVVAMVLIIAVEAVSEVFHPFPPGVDPTDFEACKVHVARYPHWLLAVAGVLWGSTVFVSVWLANRLGARRHPVHGIAVGSLLVVAAAFNMYMLPYPIWFELFTLLAFVLAIFLGIKTGRGTHANRRGAESEPDTPIDDGM